MSRILLLGASGQVGHELYRELRAAHEVFAPDSTRLDLRSPDSVAETVSRAKPEIIVNAAAYTAVDRAEEEADAAAAINAAAPGNLARAARDNGAALIHYSTDYVFDGSKATAYREDDPPQPLNTYGRTKLAGEREVMATGAAAVIFRTSWVYGLRRSNFLLTMQKLMRAKKPIGVVDDQVGAPTWSKAIAEATVAVIAKSGADPSAYVGRHAGIYHMSAGGITTWYGFAQEIRRHLADRGESPAELHAIPSADYPTPARRPANSLLDNELLHSTFGVRLQDWRNSLGECLAVQNG